MPIDPAPEKRIANDFDAQDSTSVIRLTFAQSIKYRLIRGLAFFPIKWVANFGRFLGARRARKGIAAKRLWVSRLHENLLRFRGVNDAGEREQRIIEFMGRVGKVYAEFMVQQKIVNSDHFELVGQDILDSINRPVIIVSCHLANWELVGHIASLLNRDTCDLYLPPLDPVEHRLAIEARHRWAHQRNGEAILVAAGLTAMREVGKAVRRGANIILFIDEEKDGFVSAPSLGRQIPYAGNRWFAARLAVKYQIDILPVHIEAVGSGYRAILDPVIKVPAGNNEHAKAVEIADILDDKLNAWIKPLIEHWYWLPYFEQK